MTEMTLERPENPVASGAEADVEAPHTKSSGKSLMRLVALLAAAGGGIVPRL
jgi:hypothetical protein